MKNNSHILNYLKEKYQCGRLYHGESSKTTDVITK